MTILVAGASGTTGSEVLAQIAAAGVDVRAMSRSEEKAARHRGGRGGRAHRSGDLCRPPDHRHRPGAAYAA